MHSALPENFSSCTGEYRRKNILTIFSKIIMALVANEKKNYACFLDIVVARLTEIVDITSLKLS